MPRPIPLGRGFPHPAFSAASCKTPLSRAVSSGVAFSSPNRGILRSSPMSFRRNASGSWPAAAASSSIKLSTTKPLLECSTERHHARGTLDSAKVYSRRRFGDDPLRPLRRLRWNPRFRFVRPNEHGAIHRLHASVRREGQLVDGFDFFCTGTENGVRIAFVAENSSGLGGVREKLLLKFGCRLLRRRAFVPFYFENIAALDGGPGIVRENSDSAGGRSAASAGFKWNDIANTRHGFRFRGVKGGELPAKNRAALDHGKKHTGNTRIDTKLGGTGSFVAAFKAPRVMANDGEVVGVLERNGVEIGNR